MERKVLVIGLGRFGTGLSKALNQLGYQVLVMDIDRAKIEAVATEVTHSVRGDATKESVLKDIDASSFDIGVVTMGTDIKSSVLAAILLKRLGVGYVVARASDELHGDILSRIGVDTIIYPEQRTGARLAHWIHQRNVAEYIHIAKSYGLAKLVVPVYFVGKSLSSLGFGQDGKKAVCVLIIQRGEDVTLNPKLDEIIQDGDALFIAADDETLEQLLEKALKDYEKEEQETKKNNN